MQSTASLACACALALAANIVSVKAAFVEENCLAVGEIESVGAAGDWTFGNSIVGHSGSGYFTWTGNDYFAQHFAGQHGLLEFSVVINNPGLYRIAIRNYHDDPDSTESNDVWLQVDSNPWVKVYSEWVAVWQWMTKMDLGHGDTERPPKYTLSAGTHTIRLSGRSEGFSMDKIHIYQESCANLQDALNPFFTGSSSGAPPPVVTAQPTQAQPTSGSGSLVWTEILPAGCCRDAAGTPGDESDIVIVGSRAACQAACAGKASCMGYEWQTWGSNACELHSLDDFDHTAPGACHCVRKDVVGGGGSPATPAPTVATAAPTQAVVPVATAAPTDASSEPEGAVSFEEKLPRGCCRTASGGFGEEVTPYSVSGMAECEDACADSSTCTGFEYHSWSKKCELHTGAGDFAKTSGYELCFCVEKILSAAPVDTSAPTATPTTKAPTASPTTAAPTASPTTAAPTASPTTAAPTASPTTAAPTASPTTKAPTASPTTAAPSASPSASPTPTPLSPTATPTTGAPTTASPTTASPTTASPTTTSPTTASPTTSSPTTAAPSDAPTKQPTTAAPTSSPTASPTTLAPTAAPTVLVTDAPTSALTLLDAFEEITPRGCCRTASMGPGAEVTPYKVADIDACKSDCAARADCRGLEYHTWNNHCELHTSADDFAKTSGYELCMCLKRLEGVLVTDAPTEPAPTTAPTTAAPTLSPTAEVYDEILPRGCCRTASMGSGQEVNPPVVVDGESECAALCTARSDCTGFELHLFGDAPACELHTGFGDFAKTSGFDQCICKRRESKFVGGIPPAPATSAPTNAVTKAPTQSGVAPAPAPAPGPATEELIEHNCLAVSEVEAVSATGAWKFETIVGGYAGTGYYRWTGPNYFPTSQAGKHGLLQYKLRIHTPGVYEVRVRNYHDHEDDTEENDCWLKVGSHGWVKIFSNDHKKWTFQTKVDLHLFEDNPHASFQLSAGIHDLFISGRSHNFRIDRIHVFQTSCANPSQYNNPFFVHASIPSQPLPAPAPPPPPVETIPGFLELNPRGCCRTASGGHGTELDAAFFDSLAECADWCRGLDACSGVEWHEVTLKCEAHPPEDFDHTSNNDECYCLERMDFSQFTAVSYEEITPRGCCRTPTGGPGIEGDVVTVANEDTCATMCTSDSSCTGYEWHAWDAGCELHFGVDDFAKTASHDECMCKKKVTAGSRHMRSLANNATVQENTIKDSTQQTHWNQTSKIFVYGAASVLATTFLVAAVHMVRERRRRMSYVNIEHPVMNLEWDSAFVA